MLRTTVGVRRPGRRRFPQYGTGEQSGAARRRRAFQTGAAFGGYVGFNQYKHIGGEIRYSYLQSNLSLKSGGSEATFSGMSHIVGYDVIFKTTRNNGKVQLFAAVGGGMKVFRGTGKEAAYQPLQPVRIFHEDAGL